MEFFNNNITQITEDLITNEILCLYYYKLITIIYFHQLK